MGLLGKIKETSISVVPIVLLVLILNLTAAPLESSTLERFLLSAVLVIVGLAIFLLGTDMGIVPMGHAIGNSLTSLRNMPIMLGAGFLIGFGVTVAEPDVQVLVQQVVVAKPSINATVLLLSIGLGVGFFVALALSRILFGLDLRILLLTSYAVLFLLAAFTDIEFLGIAFDSGGATTGSMTVPFILALGMGAVAVKQGSRGEDSDENFGLVGLASIGPIMAVLIVGLLSGPSSSGALVLVADAAEEAEIGPLAHLLRLIPEQAANIGKSLLPLLVIFVLAQVFLVKLPRIRLRKTIVGIIYTFIGLVLFMTGVEGGFMDAGRSLGLSLTGAAHPSVVFFAGLLFGALVVCAEPAVWVLNKQVEDLSGGHITKVMMLISLALGVALAVAGSMMRIYYNISYWYFIIPGYTVALALTFISPPLFTAIAFDSGGVASGPMSSTFLLSLATGVAKGFGGNPVTDAFGMVGLIAMMPLITIQLLGVVYQTKVGKEVG